MAHELVVQPQTVFICGCLAARTRRAAEQAHAGRRLKNVRRKRTPVHIEFHSQIACVGDPGNLVAFIKHDDLRNESNEYGTFSHFLCGPCGSGPKLLILSVHSDDSIFSGENSCELRHNAREFPLFSNFHNQPVRSGIYSGVTCTSLRLTLLLRNRTLQLFIRGAKFRLDLLRSRKNLLISV